jgi:hypothetical protein
MDDFNTLDPTKDYLSGGYLAGWWSNTGILPVISDSFFAEVGYKVYEDMMHDAKVNKCINVLKTGVVGDGIDLLSPISDTSLDYPVSAVIQKFCEYNLTNLQRPFREIVWEMLDALIYGHKVAEITYEVSKYDNKNFLILKSIKPKPFGSTSFVVDAYFNLLGITSTNVFSSKYTHNLFLNKDNFGLENKQPYIKTDGKKFKFLNRDKFFTLTVNSQNNDPRGRSVLRPAFTPWNIKNKVHCEYLRYLNTSASPLLFGTTPENANSNKPDLLVDAEGIPVKGADGKPVRINNIAALRDALVQARSSGVLAAQGGSHLQSIGGDGAGIAFYKAIEVYDSQIEMCILQQTLATSESRFQSRSASEIHYSTLELLMNSYKLLVADAITNDILKPLITYNFGEEYLKYMPKVSMGDTARRDFSLDAAAISALYSSDYLSEDQKRFTDQMLGLPIRDSEYEKIRQVTLEERLQIRKNVLEQNKLKNESAKLKEEKNRLLTEQINGLGKTLEVAPENIRTQIEAQILKLLAKMSIDDPDDVLGELEQSEISAKSVLKVIGERVFDQPDSYEAGNSDLISGAEVGTNAARQLPISQSYTNNYIQKSKKLLS